MAWKTTCLVYLLELHSTTCDLDTHTSEYLLPLMVIYEQGRPMYFGVLGKILKFAFIFLIFKY